MVEIHLYGRLRRYGPDDDRTGSHVLRVDPRTSETVESLILRLNIPLEEIYTVFFNSKLLAARSKMAVWIGYQQQRQDPFDWTLDVPVKAGDRLGLFGRDMAALVI